jgi:PPK2 family polyphosphate:nucleotide phosphotransferase
VAKPTAEVQAITEKHDISSKAVRKLLARYRVEDGRKLRLKDHDPGDTGGHLINKKDANLLLEHGVRQLSEHQEKLYAQDEWAMLCVLQAMDAAGKDGTIKHVMSGVNPQGVHITSFKAPGPEQLTHDFLWRSNPALPGRGMIGIFNRSYYEEVLVVRVHPELLKPQRLPQAVMTRHFWRDRLAAIAAHEQYLAQQGIVVLKFFLHLSKNEQKRRLLSRLDEADKNWKFDAGDLAERSRWDDYQHFYEEAIAATATPHAPWYVVPADNKWFTRLIIVAAMNEALSRLDLKFPEVSDETRERLLHARAALEVED